MLVGQFIALFHIGEDQKGSVKREGETCRRWTTAKDDSYLNLFVSIVPRADYATNFLNLT